MSGPGTEEHHFSGGEATLDLDELACRLAETATGMARPSGSTAAEAMDTMEDAVAHSFRSMADVAMAYLVERMTAGQRTLQ